MHTALSGTGLPLTVPLGNSPSRSTAWDLFNRTAAFVLLVLLSLPLLLIALFVWRADGRPVIYAHYRVGLSGKVFPCFKFRSMVKNSEQALQNLLESDPGAREEWQREQKLSNDPRITTIGKFLRRTSLDELPQLINVVRGEMNLVGPRPIMTTELARYGAARWHYLSVKPGMTGLWQVSGRNDTTYEERVGLDKHYVEKRTAWLDICILLKTLKVVAAGQGAR